MNHEALTNLLKVKFGGGITVTDEGRNWEIRRNDGLYGRYVPKKNRLFVTEADRTRWSYRHDEWVEVDEQRLPLSS